MIRRLFVCGLMLSAVSVLNAVSEAKEKHNHEKSPLKSAGFEKMKSLVGTWVSADKDGKPTDQVVSIVKLTAGGSAIHETLFPSQPMEMISVYTPDGSDVAMTHYCDNERIDHSSLAIDQQPLISSH